MNAEEKIKQTVSWFFSRINSPVIESYYISDSQNWDALCASLTILDDLQRAKTEYFSLKTINHLEAIGIMQTIYIEQDCLLTLKNALLETKETTALANYKPIRALRNEAFGHPSATGRKAGMYSRHFFDIVDNEKQLLKIINWENTGDISSDSFSLPETVKRNSTITDSYLSELKDSFIEKIKKHMQEYNIKTSNLFNHTHYTFEKLLSKENDRIAIDGYLHSVDGEISKAIEAFTERKVLNLYQRDIDIAIFFSDKLKGLFYQQTYKDTEFYAYGTSLREKIEQLKKSLTDLEKVF